MKPNTADSTTTYQLSSGIVGIPICDAQEPMRTHLIFGEIFLFYGRV